MDYWSANDPQQIKLFWKTVINSNFGTGHSLAVFDLSTWNHTTDAEFTSNLTLNDETNTFHTNYSFVENGELNMVGVSFSGNYHDSNMASLAITNYDRMVKMSGKVKSVYPEFSLIMSGRGGNLMCAFTFQGTKLYSQATYNAFQKQLEQNGEKAY